MLGNNDKSLVLPHKVSESLQSTLDSPKEVVDRLLHNLDDASLEHPKPETEKWIRCLARNAKEHRIDVFSYLREVAPAGTTGKKAETVSCSKKCFYTELEHARGLNRSFIRLPMWKLGSKYPKNGFDLFFV